MIERLLGTIAPHYCYGCNKIGTILCENCKYDIIDEPYLGCIVCSQLVGPRGVCSHYSVSYVQAWCVGERKDVLKQLVGDFKFFHVRAAVDSLAQLLDETIPDLPDGTIVTNIPTIAPHIRQRGYDHAKLLAKKFARLRKLPYRAILERKTMTVQHGASKQERIRQAATTFRLKNGFDGAASVLLIDDIATTGESLRNGARLIHDAGVQVVFVGVVAKQPFSLDDKGKI